MYMTFYTVIHVIKYITISVTGYMFVNK